MNPSAQACVIPAIPMNEAERQAALDDLKLIDSPQEERFDRIVQLAQLLFRVPIAYIALVDKDRQWFKSKVGIEANETSRSVSFCGHAILEDKAMVVPDALQDYRFAANPMVLGEPFIRFYVGQPLRGPSGHKVGTLCLADHEAREFGEHDLTMLGQIGKLVEREFTLLDKIQMQIETLKAKEELEKKGQALEKAVADLSAEKQNSEFLLTNIFPGNVAHELRANGKVKAVGHEKATVMFSDFSDFTSVAASYSPSDLVEELNRAFCLFDGLSARSGVEKLKTIGDGYLCVAGLQGDPVEAGVKMLKFAQEILGFVQKRKAEVEAAGKKYWNIRLGIHTGPLVAGVVGVKRMAYDIWGDTVNVAARVQQGSEPGRINLSKEFRDLMGDRIEVQARGAMPIKHHGEVEMFFFERMK
ncbi:MAG: GAF domain-containing protein [Verrucomicrobia bacterium]|nr:GAF domain-containing protein [Verrucomicrobiota bacterium]NBS79094.1 GAF domain-containing protein [bacterium]NBT23983.1 GAF domain-containing protein [bacterium]NBV96870.1 GAF domain-containing protein [Verrucomicrobiota bacterium]